MQFDRRAFLSRSARLAALAAFASLPSLAQPVRPSRYPFTLGVASGSPRPNAVVLWTRIITDPLGADPLLPAALPVRWEISHDEQFKRVALKGSATAMPELGHSVHVDAVGLQPDRWYWYRFMLGDAVSPVGRTRTAPAADASPASMRFAFASCQHWEFGQYGAHRHIAAAAPDLVAFLGDYIYEWGAYDLAHPQTPRRRSNESISLTDYRARYAQYKSDPHLQAAHQAAPWIVTWDDHEVANDYGADRDERRDPDFLLRRAAAYQAFYEHMPIRLNTPSGGMNRFASLGIHERFDWGRLARFHVLDNRQHRAYQACPRSGQGGSNSVSNRCRERLEDERSLLGSQQEAWLAQGFATSDAAWNILAQQTLMAQATQVPISDPEDGMFWTDGWDGYPAARRRLMDDLVRHRTANPVVISGDVHTFYAADLRRDFLHPASADNPVIATEFCGTSVTSSSRPQARVDRYLADNPHLRYGLSDRRGFVMMEVTPARTTALFRGLDDVNSAQSGVSTVASFVVENGKPGAERSG
jgi:alkaline phosphatase D